MTVPTDKAGPDMLNRLKSYNELLSDNREVLVVERMETWQLLSSAERVKSLHALMKIRPMACLLYHPSRLEP
ncbi:hypothetical protein ACN42_g3147 [Penicillium freii]|uniref:Uncharacterized protein n=1 Tax=Penicillium freii TaxID=48697 RepID=A0A124GSB9_PENFR|nr:hypothetical protein ACN42_g3147 [Penicillium freii]